MMGRLTESAARRVIFRLRSGTTSTEAARAITVGTKAIQQQLVEGAARCSNGDGTDELVFVQADWGFGKSHTRMLLSGDLFNTQTPFAYGCVDARGSSLGHIHRAVPKWLEELRIGKVVGLRRLIEEDVIPADAALRWAIDQHSDFAAHLYWALRGWPGGWMRALGHAFSTPDYSYQHPKALRLLMSVADFLHQLGHGGLVILLDEVENIDRQTDIRGRRKSYATLATLMDHPHIFPVLFVTDRFFERAKADAERGWMNDWRNWPDRAAEFVSNVAEHTVLRPPIITEQTARKLVGRIVSVYESAYGPNETEFAAERVLDYWTRTATRSIRLLVRLTVNELDLHAQRRNRRVELCRTANAWSRQHDRPAQGGADAEPWAKEKALSHEEYRPTEEPVRRKARKKTKSKLRGGIDLV